MGLTCAVQLVGFFRAAPRPARCKLSGPPTPPSRLLTLAAVQAGATVEARRNSQPCIHKCPGRDFAAGATSPIGAPRPPPPARRAGFCDLPAFWAARTACARATAAPTAGDTRGVRRRPCCDVPPPLGPCAGRGGEPRRSSREAHSDGDFRRVGAYRPAQAAAALEGRRGLHGRARRSRAVVFGAAGASPFGAPRPRPPAPRAGFRALPHPRLKSRPEIAACARAATAPTAPDTRGVRRRPCSDVPPPLGPCAGRGGEPRRSSREALRDGDF